MQEARGNIPVGKGARVNLHDELRKLMEKLHSCGLDVALCGGVALSFHGYTRFTKDIDLLVQSEDVERVKAVVVELGFVHPAAPMWFNTGTEKEQEVHRISKIQGKEILTLDLLVVGLLLKQVWEEREVYQWRGLEVPVVSAEGLVNMKRLAGRGQDRVDIEKLGFDPDSEGGHA